jgi:hypothetical protein
MQAQSPSTTQSIDFGAMFSEPTKEQGWIGQMALIGLITCVPIAGWLNLAGWMKTAARRRLDGDRRLPEANFGYMGAGVEMLLAWLPFIGIYFVSSFGGTAAGFVLTATMGDNVIVAVFTMLMGLVSFALSIVLSVTAPAIYYLHIVEEEKLASAQIGRLIEVMKKGGTQYFMLWLAFLLSGVVAQMGAFACLVGLIVTVPLGQAMMAVALEHFARLPQFQRPDRTQFGSNAGGASGTPFGVRV